MRNFYTNKIGMLECTVGSHIESALAEAKEMARGRAKAGERNDGELVVFMFGGVILNVGPESDLDLLLRDFHRAMSGYIPTVGPNPKPKLSPEDLANDERIEASNQAHRAEQEARRREKVQAKHDRVTARMMNAPAMEFTNQKAEADWQSWVDANTDFLGAGIMTYAERLARMIQLEMSEGKTFSEAYESSWLEADLEDMSGVSASAAEQVLIQTWRYGTELENYLRSRRRR